MSKTYIHKCCVSLQARLGAPATNYQAQVRSLPAIMRMPWYQMALYRKHETARQHSIICKMPVCASMVCMAPPLVQMSHLSCSLHVLRAVAFSQYPYMFPPDIYDVSPDVDPGTGIPAGGVLRKKSFGQILSPLHAVPASLPHPLRH